jgi:MOSC domain-containing protein YiiM
MWQMARPSKLLGLYSVAITHLLGSYSSMSAKIRSINIAISSQPQNWSASGNRTGIDKKPVEGLVQFANDGVAGDTVIDTNHHGGYHRAVYAYALEDAQWWEQKIGRSISPGSFGENITTQGLDVTGALIGEQWRIGDLLLEVAEPRIPCKVFSGFWDRPTLIKEFTEANRPGAYMRIIEEGLAEAGNTIDIVYRPSHGISIGDLYAAKSGAREKISEIAVLKELSDEYREWAQKVLS